MRVPRLPRRARGTTLLEVLVAAALLVTSAWLMSRWQSDAAHAHQAATRHAQAQALVLVQLETLLAQAQRGEPITPGEDRPETQPEAPFERSWWAEHDAPSGLTLVHVRVAWPGTAGRPQALERRSLTFAPAHWLPSP